MELFLVGRLSLVGTKDITNIKLQSYNVEKV